LKDDTDPNYFEIKNEEISIVFIFIFYQSYLLKILLLYLIILILIHFCKFLNFNFRIHDTAISIVGNFFSEEGTYICEEGIPTWYSYFFYYKNRVWFTAITSVCVLIMIIFITIVSLYYYIRNRRNPKYLKFDNELDE
jgi:hypothetical protein